MSNDRSTLADILLAAQRIGVFTGEVDYDAFARDLEKQSAVLHQLLVLGEAVRRLSPGFRADHPSVPWAKMVAMRNHLIHAYDRVDLSIVWETVQLELPPLVAYVESLTPSEG